MSSLLQINPGFIIILGGVLCALFPISALRKTLLILSPLLAGYMIFLGIQAPDDVMMTMQFGMVELIPYKIDNLSVIWGYVFCLAAILNGIYGFHEKCRITDSSALIYTGSAVAGVFVGDLLTLFIFWELAAISSVFLIWKGATDYRQKPDGTMTTGDTRSYASGLRYLAIHVLSGVLLLAGAVMYGADNGWDFSFGHIGLESAGGWLMLLSMGIKCGFPLLHNWMQDAYPKASVTGTVILSAFTTKLAIYALARGFAGEEILIYIGAVMTLFPVFFAVVENDLRRVLAYSLNNQLGFMVCGIGVGSALALNGVAGQVVVHIIFKSLLFMSMGAVLYRTGTAKASELGGLFRSMPYTTVFCLIGAGSIAAFPLLAAFVTKAMIIASVIEIHNWPVFAVLLFASAGVMEHSGIKVPYFTFFSHDSGKRVEEAPWNMLVAMGLASILCIFLAFPWGGYQFLYSLMPFSGDEYHPYTGNHVVMQLQLLFAAMFAFALLKKLKIYPDEKRAEIVDFDWTYRKLGKNIAIWIGAMWTRLSAHTTRLRRKALDNASQRLYQMFSPAGAVSSAAPSGIAALLTGGMLVIILIIIHLAGL